MLPPLIASFGMIDLAAGLFGLYLARLLTMDRCAEDAATTRHNATLLLTIGFVLLSFGMLWVG